MKAVWEGIAKKFNGLELSGISMACTGLAVVIASPQESLLLSIHFKMSCPQQSRNVLFVY
ncbi:hypothetical protein ABV436_001410 [Vibrio parahaemolyticus]|nr:hypothetical protein [Vibrio parahaemolyticus]EMA2528578.1 hypothetical protein [Vibrio parahaemolyticus]MBM5017406.1 hypothetical protein [Vibrio parahaemolyticus]MBM5127215.1 hypothetical protein [Vibrio parahaemolyticus]MCF9106404.1 hypothetical protein [Vibrio parahaemolyticus]